ncbi:hypothetical protein BV22DRAFT_1132401, partial [Leucogyrophana mollusca]
MAPGPIRSRNAAPSDSGSSSANGPKAPCEYCQKLFHPQGLKTHEKSCSKKVEQRKRDKEYEALALKQIKKAQKKKHEGRMHGTALGADRVRLPALDASLDSGERLPPDAPSQPLPDQPDPGDAPSYEDEHTLMNVDQMPMGADRQSTSPTSDTSMGNAGISIAPPLAPQVDSFKTEYHPNSGREAHIETFSAYGRQPDSEPVPRDNEPWRPFRCRTDFEFAEI